VQEKENNDNEKRSWAKSPTFFIELLVPIALYQLGYLSGL
jgi:hypothetical protein